MIWVVIFSGMYIHQGGLSLVGKGHMASSAVLLIYEIVVCVATVLLAASMIH